MITTAFTHTKCAWMCPYPRDTLFTTFSSAYLWSELIWMLRCDQGPLGKYTPDAWTQTFDYLKNKQIKHLQLGEFDQEDNWSLLVLIFTFGTRGSGFSSHLRHHDEAWILPQSRDCPQHLWAHWRYTQQTSRCYDNNAKYIDCNNIAIQKLCKKIPCVLL